MCLIVDKKDQADPIKITKDKTVYKKVTNILNKRVQSIHQCTFDYTLGELYETEFTYLDADIDYGYAVGFDGKVDEYYGTMPDRRILAGDIIIIAEGFHSANEIKRYVEPRKLYDEVIVKCTIPRGSLVYEDKTGLVVSDKLIINKIVKWK